MLTSAGNDDQAEKKRRNVNRNVIDSAARPVAPNLFIQVFLLVNSSSEACTGLGLTGILQLPYRDSNRGFAFIHCGNPAGLGLMSRESHRYGMHGPRESCGVDGLIFLADLRVIASDKELTKKSVTAAL